MNRVVRKLFPEPVQGSFRIIPARHPVQMWLAGSFVLAMFFQLAQGPVGGQINSVMPLGLFFTTAIMLGIGGASLLWSSNVAEDNPWMAMGFSLFGCMLLTAVMAFYLWMYVNAIPAWWTVFGFWFTLALFGGFGHRGCQLFREAARVWIWRHRVE